MSISFMKMKLSVVIIITLTLFVPTGRIFASDVATDKTINAIYLPMSEYYKALDNANNEAITINKVNNWQQAQKSIAAGEANVVFITCPTVFEMLLQKQNAPYSKGLSPISSVPEQKSSLMIKIIESRIGIIKKYAADPIIINAVKKQNSRATSLEEITMIDKKWIAGSEDDFIETVLNNNISRYLSKKVKSNKLYIQRFFFVTIREPLSGHIQGHRITGRETKLNLPIASITAGSSLGH